MIRLLLNWFFSPPSFYDEDEKQTALVLSVAISVIGLVAVLRTIYAALTTPSGMAPVLMVNSILLITLSICYGLMRWGFLTNASILLTGFQWSITAVTVWAYGGASISNYSIFVFVIFVAGLLLGGRWAIGYATISILYGGLVLYFESQGVLTPYPEDGNFGFLITTPSFFTTAVLVYLYDRNIKQALALARHNEALMTRHARELESANEKLAREIQERLRLEEELLQTQKLEAIGRLSGGIAHDLNNLLVPINGYAEIALMQAAEDDLHYKHLQQIKKAADRAAALTRQILAFSRKQVLEVTSFSADGAIQALYELTSRLVGDHIEIRFNPNLATPPIRADKTQFEQVIMNLIINARDAMPEGGRITINTTEQYLDATHPAVRQRELTVGSYIVITVSDTGHGIPHEMQKQIFDPFFTTKKMGQGTGLGLSTVFGIVKQHNGYIWVYSEPNLGTTCKIYWPSSDKPASPIVGQAVEPHTFRGTETIMVVEDHEMVRQFTVETLTSFGYRVHCPDTPLEALAIAANPQETIDLLLTDVVMPGMNGLELYNQIITYRPELRVLYVLGYTNDIIGHHGWLEEEVDLLPKPFSVLQLVQRIRQVLG